MSNESLAQLWRARYGLEAPNGLPEVTSFLRHRSVRRFTDETISERVVEGLVAAGQSASTSSNLQLYSLISVQEPERRARLNRLSANQNQVRDAAWFFAFLADHHRIRCAAEASGQDPAGLDYAEFYTMAVIDASLAAERMICAAESLGLGICLIGALRNDAEGVARELELPDGVFGLFGLCIGHPADDEVPLKPRLGQPAIWHRETYDPTADCAEYDERMKGVYSARGQDGDVTWSMRSGRRVNGEQMTGRETLKGWLEERGFNRR